MTEFLQYVIFGIGIGGALTLLSQGLVVTYRGSGILNFAHAAEGMFGGFLFWQLRGGAIAGSGLSTPWAFIVSILAVACLGVLIHVLVMRPLRDAAPLVRIVATLGVLVTFEAVASIIWGELGVSLEQFLPTNVITVHSLSIGVNQVIMFGIACCLTLVLWVVDRFTRVGLIFRANAENQSAASALGLSPDILAATAWAVGGALSATAIIFLGTLAGLQTGSTTLLIFPILAVGLIGSFRSFPLTLVGAMLIGIGQSLVAGYVTLAGAGDALPLLIVIGIVVVRGERGGIRTGGEGKLPGLGTGRVYPAATIASIVVACVLLVTLASAAFDASVSISLGWALVLLSVVVLLGFTGQLSFEQVVMAGLAALISGRLVQAGWPFLPAYIVAVVAAVPIGVLFALPAIRAKGINLAIVTLAMAVTVSDLLFGNSSIIGSQAGTPVGESESFFGLNINAVTHAQRYVIFCLVIFAVCAIGIANMRRGSAGRRLIAVRTNERAAAALGINVFAVKIYAFVVGATVAAIGGVLLAFTNATIDYTQFSPYDSALGVAYAVVGGVGYVIGPLLASPIAVGGVGSYLMSLVWNQGALYLALAGGVLVIIYLILDPNGLASMNVELARRVMARVARISGRPVLVTEPVETPAPAPAAPHRVDPRSLSIHEVSLHYGGVLALESVSFSVEAGEVVGLIGPNGAGKTSLMDVVSGFVRPSHGQVRLGTEPMAGWSVDRRSRSGLGRSFQSLELFEHTTVKENLGAGSDVRIFPSGWRDFVRPRPLQLDPMAMRVVEEFGLESLLEEDVSRLPYGTRRMVAVARAMSAGPSVVMLDEPASGLSTRESEGLAQIIRRFASRWGMAVMVVEHDMGFVSLVCDRVVVLDFGRTIAAGEPGRVLREAEVVAAYLGEEEMGEETVV